VDPDDLPVGEEHSARVFSAIRSLGSLKVGTITTPFAM
jgi:hypothetical protein